ncbi:unnamed protein product [Clonostachys rosea f. rosea IK726]|jgi:hypothetical protein|uniref:Uncharacterized protein n=1 Tax=Clonostachys rosea f. rosea IK726 TaxID=1349383 RepID=A0ACA9UL38_BIOOC|nr:unnamed protein product [Clonostachys rosea f. rosea IK726]
MKNTPRTGEKRVEVAINNFHSQSPHNSRDQFAQLEASDNSNDTELNTPRPIRCRFDNNPNRIAQPEASDNSDDTELNRRFDNDQIAQLEAANNLGDAELKTPRPKRRRFGNNIDQIARQEDKNYSNDPEPKERESVPAGPTCDNQVTEILSQLTIVNTKLEEIGSTIENQVHDLKEEVETLNKTFSLKETQLEETEKEMIYMLEQKTDEWREEMKKMAADWKDELQRMAENWKDELIESILHRNPSHVSMQWRHRRVE